MSKVQVDTIVNKLDNGSPNCSKGLVVTGVTTTDTLQVGTGLTINSSGLIIGVATISNSLTASSVTINNSLTVDTNTFYVNPTNSRVSILTTSPTQTFQVGSSSTSVFVIDGSGEVGLGTLNPTSTLHVNGGDSRFRGVIETVSAATTYMSGTAMVLEMDVRQSTTYTYTIPTGANIGIVSFRNMPAQTGSPCGSTLTLIVTQNAAGTGNTTAGTGIGTNCTVVGYENGINVAGISTRALVGSATTATLSSTGGDIDFVSFFINYNGGTNTTSSSYKVYTTLNGGFRRGTIGV